MFNKILETAQESGAEVLIQLKDFCGEQYKGRVLELEEEYFSLFHSGPGGGIHWAFKRADIAFCGLVVELPDAFNEFKAVNLESDMPKNTNPNL